MVVNEASNWQNNDKGLLDRGTYPAAIIPALAFFTYHRPGDDKPTGYFLMPGVKRMGLLYNIPNVKLFDVKGLLGRGGSAEENLMLKFPQGLGVPRAKWNAIANSLVEALTVLQSAKFSRMDYSMLFTMITTPLSALEGVTFAELTAELPNGVFYAVDLDSNSRLQPADIKDVQYAVHLQGISDHLETFSNKTTGTKMAMLVNYPRQNILIESNPIQKPSRFSCRLFVFLMLKLFVAVDDSNVPVFPAVDNFGDKSLECKRMADGGGIIAFAQTYTG
jgi:hypothetical protein